MTTDRPVWFIAEYLCEIPHIRLLTRAMEKNLTRLDPRSVSAEMHSGFPELRAALPMDITARMKTGPLSDQVQEQVTRILAIWESALTRSGGRDAFLFGRFSIADAFYAPVATRFVTHGIELPPLQRAYVERLVSLPPMQEWAAAARQ